MAVILFEVSYERKSPVIWFIYFYLLNRVIDKMAVFLK